jgi:hypothetical protein
MSKAINPILIPPSRRAKPILAAAPSNQPASVNRADTIYTEGKDVLRCASSTSGLYYLLEWDKENNHTVTSCDCIAFGKSGACRHMVLAQYVLDTVFNAAPEGCEFRSARNEEAPCEACHGIVAWSWWYKPYSPESTTSGDLRMTTCCGCGRKVIL